jgi:hypothetical protein
VPGDSLGIKISMGPISRLCQGIRRLRDSIEQLVAGPVQEATFPARRTGALSRVLGQPKLIVWILLMMPALVWLGFGGLPQTARLQWALTTRSAWIAVRVLSFLGLAWMGWNVALGIRRWSQLIADPLGEIAAVSALRLVSGGGALLLGAYSLALVMAGRTPDSHVLSNVHVLEAVAAALLIGTLLTAVAAVVMFPPAGVLAEAAGDAFASMIFERVAGIAAMSRVLQSPRIEERSLMKHSASGSRSPTTSPCCLPRAERPAERARWQPRM